MTRRIVTQIGSLPFDNVEDAIKYSLSHDIPFLPELPKIPGDSMSEYIKNPGNLSSLRKFKDHSYDVVKIQCIGPYSLLSDPLFKNIPAGQLDDKVLEICMSHICGIIDGLKAREIILFLDEACLGESGRDYNELWDPLFSLYPFTAGVHVCQRGMDFDRIFSTNVDILSFDATDAESPGSSQKVDIRLFPKYNSFREKGGRISWGIKMLEDIDDFQKGDLITLPCGMSPIDYKVENAYAILESLQRISCKVSNDF